MLLDLEEAKQKKVLAPIPTIEKVTEKGLVTVRWDKSMKIPRNITFVREQNTTWFFSEIN